MIKHIPEVVLVSAYLFVMGLIGYGIATSVTLPPLTHRCINQ